MAQSSSSYKIYARYTISHSIDIKETDGQMDICRGANACFFKIDNQSILFDAKEILRYIDAVKADKVSVYFDEKKKKFYVKKPRDKQVVYLSELSLTNAGIKRFYGIAKSVSSVESLKKALPKGMCFRKPYFLVEKSSGLGEDPLTRAIAKHKAASKKRRGGKGEGDEHKKLKEFVKNHPEMFGLPKDIPAEIECPLPSGDRVDVAFIGKKQLVLVEVKPDASDEADVKRGLYQCVKYAAVAKKWLKFEGLPHTVRAVLVLESELPKSLLPLKNALGFEVHEKIKPNGKTCES